MTNLRRPLLLQPCSPSWLHCYRAFEFRKGHLPEIILLTDQITAMPAHEIKTVGHYFIEAFIVTIAVKKATTLQAALSQ